MTFIHGGLSFHGFVPRRQILITLSLTLLSEFDDRALPSGRHG